jgi:predicted nucleic acid-binding protein
LAYEPLRARQNSRKLWALLKGQGRQPPILDMLVAVVSHRSGATLWHFGDHHFRAIKKVLAFPVEDLVK